MTCSALASIPIPRSFGNPGCDSSLPPGSLQTAEGGFVCWLQAWADACWLPCSHTANSTGNRFIFTRSRGWHLCQAKPYGKYGGRDMAQQEEEKNRNKN